MFPVENLSSLNSYDISFLDDFCLSEDKHDKSENMADLNMLIDTCIPESNILSDDWLSGNINIDAVIADPNFDKSGEFNNLLHLDYSSTSLSSYPISESLPCSSVDMLMEPPGKEFLQMKKLGSEEAYSSNDTLLIENQITQSNVSLLSEDEDSLLDNICNDSYSQAGKKYLQMRKKNNIASQRSRKLRKQKNSEMVGKLKELEKENEMLKLLVSKMEKERDALQRQVIQIISKK